MVDNQGRMFDHNSYISRLGWQYGSDEMRRIWSEINKRKIWRRVWVALASAQLETGIISDIDIEVLEKFQEAVNLPKALKLEEEMGHDLMAELAVYSEQCGKEGRFTHLGATSMDIEDNAEIIRIRSSLEIIYEKGKILLEVFNEQVLKWAKLPVTGFTHIQPATPVTLGYRLAFYAQDIFQDLKDIKELIATIKGKGIKGAVGSFASFQFMLEWAEVDEEKANNFENLVMEKLGLEAYTITGQVYPRKQDWKVMNALAGLSASIYKFASDLRLMQSVMFGEVLEPAKSGQVSSSTMPYKRNPVNAEKINSLARMVGKLPSVFWDNAALNTLERSLDDGANRSLVFPTGFLAMDEILDTAIYVVSGLEVNESRAKANFEKHITQTAGEKIMLAATIEGGNRNQLHARLMTLFKAYRKELNSNKDYSLTELLCRDDFLLKYLPQDKIKAIVASPDYIGNTLERTNLLVDEIRNWLENESKLKT